MLSFEVLSRSHGGRLGRLITPHGPLDTPAFMPVATLGAVKGIAPDTLEELGGRMLLTNLYHLALRPGIDTLEALGGLHAFTSWSGPILTDSGGFQVFSLASRREIDDDGVTFRSHLDGARLRFTPASVVEMQRRLGVDVAMVLDECPPWPVTEEEARAASERTVAWARRSREAWEAGASPGSSSKGGGLFAIVQGSGFRRLREEAAAELTRLEFDGYAIGGVSVGEPEAERRATVEHAAPLLPEDKPRYLMGVGTPEDLLHAVASGLDLFDCVLPARNARHGLLFVRSGSGPGSGLGLGSGVLKLKNARYKTDPDPPDPGCSCPTCRRVSRAFLAHLFRSGEITAQVLATVHNLAFYLDFMADIREACASGTLAELSAAGPTAAPAEPPSRAL